MREESPLGESALTRRVVLPAQGPGSEAAGKSVTGVNSHPAADAQPVAAGPEEDSSKGSLLGPAPADLPGPGPRPGTVADAAATLSADQLAGTLPGTEHLDAEVSSGPDHSLGYLNHHAGPEVAEAPPDDTAGRNGLENQNGRATSIYDEYRELLEETKLTPPTEDEPVGPPLDINVLSNLVHWVALAKQRVGEEQMKDILQLYIQSGHSRPELQDLLLQVSHMVDAEALYLGESPREWVDLMFHLHGILTGGFPVIKIPPIRLVAPDDHRGDGN
jgi:hypothetical protein